MDGNVVQVHQAREGLYQAGLGLQGRRCQQNQQVLQATLVKLEIVTSISLISGLKYVQPIENLPQGIVSVVVGYVCNITDQNKVHFQMSHPLLKKWLVNNFHCCELEKAHLTPKSILMQQHKAYPPIW